MRSWRKSRVHGLPFNLSACFRVRITPGAIDQQIMLELMAGPNLVSRSSFTE